MRVCLDTHCFSQGRSDAELSFKRGDIITVMDILDDHWWKGMKDNVIGFVAAAYVDKNPLPSGNLSSYTLLCESFIAGSVLLMIYRT
jgi:hypothetical protein